MRIRLRERDLQSRRWQTLVDQRVSVTSCLRIPPLDLNERSDLGLFLYAERADGWGMNFDTRLVVGNFPVASTLERDRPDFLLRPGDDEDGSEFYFCTGPLLRDWVGQTELHVEVLGRAEVSEELDRKPAEVQGPERLAATGEHWTAVLSVDVNIAAGKMEQEAFEALCAEVADYSAGMLLDVYGKTFVNLELERKIGENAPILVLQRVRHVLDQLAAALRDIARRPAYRLKGQRIRQPALAAMAVSDLTLEETCLDPTLAVPLGDGEVHFRERVHEVASPNFDLPENRLISGFLQFISLQVRDLKRRMQHEVEVRLERKEFRNRRTSAGGKTWWESEDLPRIEELENLLGIVEAMGHDLAVMMKSPFLPPAPPLRNVPPSTPLLRHHKAYSSAFKIIVNHFQAYRVQVDDKHLVLRARSLPVLYEWWCLLEVLKCLRSCLNYAHDADTGARTPFRRLAEERDRFVMEFEPNQAVDFADSAGRLIRVRYVPSYWGYTSRQSEAYGVLGFEGERTPDIAVEIFPPGDSSRPPEVILVFDAKYSSDAHAVKLNEVNRKYGKIGLFKNGKVLSRQVWALTPMPAALAPPRQLHAPEWASFCTVDNLGFWREDFDMNSVVTGVVQARPKMPAGRPPLDSLLRLLLKRAGVVLQG